MDGSLPVRRSLGRQLKALRQAAGKSLSDVALTKIMSKAKLARIEGGKNAVRVADVIALCRLYRADEPTTDRLAETALNIDQGSWWEDFVESVPPAFGTYVDLQDVAEELWTFSPNLVPGLLQTTDYHRAVFEADPVLVTTASLDGQLRLRAERQRRVFGREPPLRITAILEESAVRRQVGGPEVQRRQNEYLVEMSQRETVEVLILADEAGAHPGMKGAFNRLGFGAAPEPDLIYLETLVGGRLVERADQVERFTGVFEQMRAHAIAIEEFMG